MLRYRLRPAFYDLDWMGIVNNLSYVRWLEDIRTRLLDISPYPMARLMTEQLSPALLSTHLDYLAAYNGVEGGGIEVRITAGGKMGRSRWELIYDFHHATTERHLVHAIQTGCFVQLPQVTPARIPPEMSAFLRHYLDPTTDFPLD